MKIKNLDFRVNSLKAVVVKRIYLTAALVFILAAWFSEGYNHLDEHCQINEFAALKLGLAQKSDLAWEYDYKIRPAIQPFIVYCVSQASSVTGTFDPFLVAFFTRLIAAAISFISILMVCRYYTPTFSEQKLRDAFLLLSFLLWFSVFNSVRFSSETLSGRIFIIGFTWFLLNGKESWSRYFITGLIMGFAFLFRYQAGLLIFGFAAWIIIINRTGFKKLIFFCLGILLVIMFGVLIDRWFYEEWTCTIWNYFQQNILLQIASQFGTSPWWSYFEMIFINGVPPFSLIYILAFLIYILYKPKDILTWSVLPFLLSHVFISHKEIRFLFPLIGFVPVMIIRSVEIIQRKREYTIFKNRFFRLFIKLFWITNFILVLISTFKPSDDQMSLYRKIYYKYDSPVKLYYTGENPYHFSAIDINFYKRKNLILLNIDSVEKIIPARDTVTLAVLASPDTLFNERCKPVLIYSSYPDWIFHFNFNNWIERTSLWYVYQLTTDK